MKKLESFYLSIYLSMCVHVCVCVCVCKCTIKNIGFKGCIYLWLNHLPK